MQSIFNHLIHFFEYSIFFYAVFIMVSYLLIAFVSARLVAKYKKEQEVIDYDELLASPLLPSIAIIAPAYNEGITIVDNIRSLLSLHYSNLSVIVVNDGSKDDTVQKAIEAYDLEQVDFFYNERIPTQKVRGIYKSTNPAFKKLIFVDKENGRKADAINAGINIANTDYFACIDVDCIIEPDAFLKMVRPIMQAGEKKMVAVGGIVWLVNDAIVKRGSLIQVKAPENFIPRIQVIEYFRAFLLGRTAWSSINGLLLISGAFGLFDRNVAIAAGGYRHDTVGEDMELVMRMHRYMRDRKEKYQVGYIPEPLCWTEAPDNYKVLGSQRHRWTRGTVECLSIHRKMCFNPKYGVLGMLSYPYWFLAEWAAPFIETGGILFFILAAFLGLVNWPVFFALLGLVYTFSIFFSVFAIYIQEKSYFKYREVRDILKLVLTAMKEPVLYHPRVTYWALKGNFDLLRNKNTGWGNMTRRGFKKA